MFMMTGMCFARVAERFLGEVALIVHIIPKNAFATLMIVNAIVFTNEIFSTDTWMWSKVEIGICAMEDIQGGFYESGEEFVRFIVFW